MRWPKADENGEPLYVVQLLVMGEDSADLIAVKVPGVPSTAIRQARPSRWPGWWPSRGRWPTGPGCHFRAARIEPAIAAAKAS